MKKTIPTLMFILGILVSFTSYYFTYSFFSSSVHNNANAFASAASFINPGDIIINEINWAGSNGDGLDEWLELRNTTGHSINLSGWVVENLGTGSGPGANIVIPSGTILANGFFLVSQNNKAGSKINVDPDFITTAISLSNGGEQLVLRTSTVSGLLIDTANGTGAWFNGSNSTPKKSMERKDPPGDGTSSGNWQTATTHTGMDSSGSTDEFGTPKNSNGL